MKYNKPIAEIIKFDNQDIITTSGEIPNKKPNKEDKPGNGYGDKNHNHYGPPGQSNK